MRTLKCVFPYSGFIGILCVISCINADDLREGFFNNSAFVRLNTPISLQSHIGLNFKSCAGGELFSQQTNGNSIALIAQQDGIAVVANVMGKHIEVKLISRLLDSAWHSVNLIYRMGNLTLYAGGHQQVVANKTFNSEILNPALTSESSVLKVGTRFHGCILEGPSLVLEPTNLLQSVNVAWGPCPLKSIECRSLDMCSYEPCMNHGTCISHPDHYECKCTSRYSGRNCEQDNGSECDKRPCLNDGECREDNDGNFHCVCNAAYSGKLCEISTSGQLCEVNTCLNNGTCRIPSVGSDRPECTCQPGFRGNLCEININECLSNPCGNGGTCHDGDNSYTCTCGRSGYKGDRCDVNVNECESTNPCLNQGTCFDNYGGYTCQCPSGFAGQNCELNLNECSSGPCLNNGLCEDLVGTYRCDCNPPFGGFNCEINTATTIMGPMSEISMPNNCASSPPPCGPEADCVDTVESFKCVCKPGFIGVHPNCTDKMSFIPCQTNICQNGGTCFVSHDQTICNCPPGFTGSTCYSHIECQSSPCLHGGTCIGIAAGPGYVCSCPDNHAGERCERSISKTPCSSTSCDQGVCVAVNTTDYRCVCHEGYSGESCSERCLDGDCRTILTDPCTPSPCNNGTCQSVGDSFMCACNPGYTGPDCSEDINECSNRSICNNGICHNLNGSFQCFCQPGYAGSYCNFDIDECLSHPCKNNATCENRINEYYCQCLPGFSDPTCSIDIDECASNPCQNQGTCHDHINSFTCTCPPGLTGLFCETNIDDCMPQPCQNGGKCIDGINTYQCNCSETGFEGEICENNIDDCRSDPCSNSAKCVDLINDYRCECYPGYTGGNCEIDINECEKSPCLNNGTCYEHSSKELYGLNNGTILPPYFNKNFDISLASGYECVCIPGIIGANCEKDVDECDSNPCVRGSCLNRIGTYFCECPPGFEGDRCENEINECEKFKPCDKGFCEDRRNDYFCVCQNLYGGKNCSVPLTGCSSNSCLHGGTCIPYLENETEHKFNCSCPGGRRGKICEKVTAMSLGGSSHVIIKKPREEGYDIQFKLKTTLPSGLLAVGEGLTYYFLHLKNGRLNLRSSLLNRIEGVSAGSGLNDSKWQRVFVAINSSHLVLGANDEQTIYPISLTEANTSHTSFMTTYLGGTVSQLMGLANGLPFVGCMEDVVVNGEWIIPEDKNESFNLTDIEVGCHREEQCNPNLCQSGGQCTDLWRTFNCTCVRPFLGHTCQYSYTAATFGHENTTGSLVTVDVHDSALQSFRSVIDISMFIRTRQERGLIFYLGSLPGMVKPNKETFIVAELDGGELKGNIQFGSNREAYSVGGTRLDNGYSHLIQVVRNGTLVAVRINGTENFRKTISQQEPLIAHVLYLGGMPTSSLFYPHHPESTSEQTLPPRRTSRQIEAPPFKNENPFKGVIQDVQISNGSRVMVVEFFPLHVKDLAVPPSFGNLSFDETKVLKGAISDDTCRSEPCSHEGICSVTWNDYECECPHGYKGKSCEDMEFCQLQDCPSGSECRNLDDGYECISNITLRGIENDLLRYHLVGVNDELVLDSVRISFRSHTGGTILHITQDNFYFSVSAFLNETTISWRMDNSSGHQQRFSINNADDEWVSLYFEMRGGTLTGGIADSENPEFTATNFSSTIWRDLLKTGNVVIGGVDPRLDNDIPLHSKDTAGRYFKGCLGAIRIGRLLLPYYTPDLLYNVNFTAPSYFELSQIPPGPQNISGCVLCFEHECLNGGVCENSLVTHRCNCSIGYERDDCSKDIDWCRSSSCQNNATCFDGIANYTCDCLPGYTGVFCEIDINECESSPCIHGTCQDLIAGYVCQCNESYTGRNCESFKVVTCSDKPCGNGSTCVDGFNKVTADNFTCECADGYVGRLCNEPYCKVRACQKGHCGFTTRPQCLCSLGYEGQYCENDINECDANPCQNGGICTDLVGNFSCDCADTGFQGFKCEKDVDECAVHRDLCGEGICNNTIGSYKCICDAKNEEPMCGNNCNFVDPCSKGQHCEHGGTCIEACTSLPDYTCICPPEFGGKNCSETIVSQGTTAGDVAIIVGPIVAFLLLAGGVGLTIFLMMARNKRATRGTYSPSQQEYCNPRVEMDNVLKPPPEERLI